MSATRTQTRSEDEQPDEAESSGRLIALTSTLGGLGATTLTLMLARALSAQGVRVAVVDADPAGGLGMHLGDRLARGLVWADVPCEETSFRAAHLTRALPVWCGCRVLTGDGRGGPEDLAATLVALERALLTERGASRRCDRRRRERRRPPCPGAGTGRR